MNLIKLSDAFSACLESSEDIRLLFKIAHLHKDTLNEAFKDTQLLEPHLAYKALFRWLDLVVYTTSTFLPHLNEENAHNIALAHPLAIWLFKYYETIESCCAVGLVLSRLVKLPEIPNQLIRLLELTERFKRYILPKMLEYHKASVEEVKQFAPKFIELFSPIPKSEEIK